MKGVASAVLALALIMHINGGPAYASASTVDSVWQFGQFCYSQKLSGNGTANMSISLEDDIKGLDYTSSMAGEGNFEIEQINEYSQDSKGFMKRVDALNDTTDSSLFLFEHLNMRYTGSRPLIGETQLDSAVGGAVAEKFSVDKMERVHDAFVATSANASANPSGNNSIDIMGVGIKNSFDGDWNADANWHELLSKDVKAHEAFRGRFEVEKSFKFLGSSG
jgi:hypothetical protein